MLRFYKTVNKNCRGKAMNERKKSVVTIDEVAKLCGVSKTTVSRFLNGKYENMSEKTREQISRVIAQVNYHPNRSAQRLKAGCSMLIGCVIGDISSPFSALLLKGISAVCEEAGYQVLFADSGEDPVRERRAVMGFLGNRVDGLIVNTCGGNDEFLLELQRRGVCLALADRKLMSSDEIDTVTVPNESAAYDCTRFLFKRGYTRVGFFSETIGTIAPRILRRRGYERAVRELSGAGPELYEFAPGDLEGCKSCLHSFRDKYPGERIAILSSNGASARRLLIAMKELDLEPGYSLGLCTFDDWDWLKIARPRVSAVAMASETVGAKAAQLLLERISGSRPRGAKAVSLELSTRLIVRESTPSWDEG